MRPPSHTFSGAMRAPAFVFALIASFSSIACGRRPSPLDVSTARGPEAVPADAGVSDGSAPDAGVIAAESPDAPPWADDCPAPAPALAPSFRSVHFELAPRGEGDEGESSTLPGEVRIEGANQDVFPAVNREGTIMVERFGDMESFTGHNIDSVGFYSVVTGKTLGFYVLSSDPDETSPAALQKEHRRLAHALAGANQILDKYTWRRISSDQKPDGPCPGTPWTKLDLSRSQRDEWSWARVTRFDREGLDFEYQPVRDDAGTENQEKVVVRALQPDGTIREVSLPLALVPPGETTWMANERRRCGSSEGFYGFGSRELGVFFVYSDEHYGGDSCGAVLSGKRTTLIRLPPELRTAR